jgi:hypothetical protein
VLAAWFYFGRGLLVGLKSSFGWDCLICDFVGVGKDLSSSVIAKIAKASGASVEGLLK